MSAITTKPSWMTDALWEQYQKDLKTLRNILKNLREKNPRSKSDDLKMMAVFMGMINAKDSVESRIIKDNPLSDINLEEGFREREERYEKWLQNPENDLRIRNK